jgi:hypothetical protein
MVPRAKTKGGFAPDTNKTQMGGAGEQMSTKGALMRRIRKADRVEAEKAALRHELELLDRLEAAEAEVSEYESVEPLPEFVKCATFTPDVQRKREFLSVEKSLYLGLQAENARLREALRRVIDLAGPSGIDYGHGEIARIAREALGK